MLSVLIAVILTASPPMPDCLPDCLPDIVVVSTTKPILTPTAEPGQKYTDAPPILVKHEGKEPNSTCPGGICPTGGTTQPVYRRSFFGWRR